MRVQIGFDLFDVEVVEARKSKEDGRYSLVGIDRYGEELFDASVLKQGDIPVIYDILRSNGNIDLTTYLFSA